MGVQDLGTRVKDLDTGVQEQVIQFGIRLLQSSIRLLQFSVRLLQFSDRYSSSVLGTSIRLLQFSIRSLQFSIRYSMSMLGSSSSVLRILAQYQVNPNLGKLLELETLVTLTPVLPHMVSLIPWNLWVLLSQIKAARQDALGPPLVQDRDLLASRWASKFALLQCIIPPA